MREEEKEMYILHAGTPGYKRRIQYAEEIAKRALEEYPGRASLSYSGGKDSTVMLDICYNAGFRGYMVQFFYSLLENPQMNLDMADWAAEHYGLELKRLKCYSVTEAWEEVGYFYVVPTNDIEKKLARKADTDFRQKSEELAKSEGCVLQFIGMRKAESKQRKMTLGRRGLLYDTKNRTGVTCCPIGKLTDDDIWAYIVTHDLPYLSCYDNPFFDRRKIRNELNYMCTKKAIFQGIVEKYKIIYPEIFAEIKSKYTGTENYM